MAQCSSFLLFSPGGLNISQSCLYCKYLIKQSNTFRSMLWSVCGVQRVIYHISEAWTNHKRFKSWTVYEDQYRTPYFATGSVFFKFLVWGWSKTGRITVKRIRFCNACKLTVMGQRNVYDLKLDVKMELTWLWTRADVTLAVWSCLLEDKGVEFSRNARVQYPVTTELSLAITLIKQLKYIYMQPMLM